MKPPFVPPHVNRWADEGTRGVPHGVRSALEAARSDGPSAAQLERLIASVTTPVPPAGSGGGSSGGLSSGKSTTAAIIKSLAGVLGTLALGYGFWAWSSVEAPLETRESVAVAPTVVAPEPLPVAVELKAAPPKAAAPAKPHVRVTRAASVLAPNAPAASAPALPQEQRTVADEVALLQRAKRALLGKPGRALLLLQEHERDFVRGAFIEEREALAIEALFALHQPDQAGAQLNAFRARYPRSTYLRRLDAFAH